MTTPEILRQAAVEIRKGWTQHQLFSADGGACANGAIIAALTGRRCASYRWDVIERGFLTAIVPLQEVIGSLDIPKWNNASDQTAENVAATMELAAICFEQAHAQPENTNAVDPSVQPQESGTRA